MHVSDELVKSYYDDHVIGKLKDFVGTNSRVEKAWQTIEKWSPGNPTRILEIGCGIGSICDRMAYHWPDAEVVGIDISPKSIEIAKKLFGSPRVSFIEGSLEKGLFSAKFDLILLMDVYEHIAVADRPLLHKELKELQSDESRIILTFPTPHHQEWLRKNKPDGLQPVDEDIHIFTILQLASDVGAEVILYQTVDVWNEKDYAHAVLSRSQHRHSISKPLLSRLSLRYWIQRFFLKQARLKKADLIRKKFGSEINSLRDL